MSNPNRPPLNTTFANSKAPSTLPLVSGAVLISLSASFVKWADVGSATAGVYRMFIGGIVLVLVAVFALRSPLWLGHRLFVRQCLCGLVMGIDLVLWHESINLVGPGLATLLGNFQVFLIAAFGVIFLNERLTANLVIGTVLAFVGFGTIVAPTILVALDGQFVSGVVYGLLTAVAYTTYLLLLKGAKVGSHLGTNVSNMAVISLLTALVLLVLGTLKGESLLVVEYNRLVFLVALGLLPQAMGWVLITAGMIRVSTPMIGLVLLIQPTLSYVWDIWFFQTRLSMVQYGGVAISLVAILLTSLRGISSIPRKPLKR